MMANIGLRGLAPSEIVDDDQNPDSFKQAENITKLKQKIHDNLVHMDDRWGRPGILGLQECGSLFDFEPAPYLSSKRAIVTDAHVDYGTRGAGVNGVATFAHENTHARAVSPIETKHEMTAIIFSYSNRSGHGRQAAFFLFAIV